MAATEAQFEQAVQLLPANGSEVTYDEWFSAMRTEGLDRAMAKAMVMKQKGLVKFRLVANEDFSSSLFVKRGTE